MKRNMLRMIAILIFFFALVVITSFVLLFLGYRDLSMAKDAFLHGKIGEGTNFALAAKKKLAIVKNVAVISRRTEIANTLTGFEEMAAGLSSMGKASLLLQQSVAALLSGKSYEKDAMRDASFAYTAAKTHFDTVETSLLVESSKLPLFKDKADLAKDDILQLLSVVETGQSFVGLLPKIVPREGEKKYLLLFQNNMELRPTGGFIGSFAVLGFRNGTLSEFTIYDVYDADGQLKGHVEPPMPIRKYLPQVNWFLRDSNWNVDFQESVEMAQWFLEKEIGIAVDGVIGIDVTMAKLLLDATGPVYLTDYQENITKDNVFEKTHLYTQKDFFPGSRQKKDFLGSLIRSIREKLTSQDTSLLALLSSFQKGSEQKHLLFSFFDPSVQSVFNINKWAGSLPKNIKQEGDINDFFAIREANLGVNKVNYSLKRHIEHTVNIKEEAIYGNLTVIYDNQDQNNQAGGAPYKNYIRVYLAGDASVDGISIDGKRMVTVPAEKNPLVYEKKDFFKNLGDRLELEQGDENGFLMLGFFLEVPQAAQKVVSVQYLLPKDKVAGSKAFSYRLTVSKQPGTDDDPFVVNVSYPNTFALKPEGLPAVIKEGTVAVSLSLLKDQELTLKFSQKEY